MIVIDSSIDPAQNSRFPCCIMRRMIVIDLVVLAWHGSAVYGLGVLYEYSLM